MTEQADEVTVKNANGDNVLVPTTKAVTRALTGGTPTEASTLHIVAGGEAQDLFAANASRKTFYFGNTSNADGGDGWDMYVRFSNTDDADQGVGMFLPPGGSVLLSEGSTPLCKITVWCSHTNATLYAFEI